VGFNGSAVRLRIILPIAIKAIQIKGHVCIGIVIPCTGKVLDL